MRTIIALFTCLFISTLGFSHEGHDQVPNTLKSRHGGIVQAGKQINLEVIIVGSTVTLFPVNHAGKDLGPTEVTIKATAKPKKGKSYSVPFKQGKMGFVAKVDLSGANRLPIEIDVTNEGKKDLFKIQVEE